MSYHFFCYQTCLWHASMFYQGVIHQLCWINFTQFWPPSPSNGQFRTIYMIPTQGPHQHGLAKGALAPLIFWHFFLPCGGHGKILLKLSNHNIRILTSRHQAWTFYWLPSPLLLHIVIEWLPIHSLHCTVDYLSKFLIVIGNKNNFCRRLAKTSLHPK